MHRPKVGMTETDRRQLEFYPPNEPSNPFKGLPTIEIRNPDLKGDRLQQLIAAEMMHYLPTVDNKFKAYREQLRGTITPQQMEAARRRYEHYQDKRPFEEYFDTSDFDQFIGGYLFPPAPGEGEDWREGGHYQPNQIEILEQMRRYMQGLP